jgi:hypothetical protein
MLVIFCRDREFISNPLISCSGHVCQETSRNVRLNAFSSVKNKDFFCFFQNNHSKLVIKSSRFSNFVQLDLIKIFSFH